MWQLVTIHANIANGHTILTMCKISVGMLRNITLMNDDVITLYGTNQWCNNKRFCGLADIIVKIMGNTDNQSNILQFIQFKFCTYILFMQ